MTNQEAQHLRKEDMGQVMLEIVDLMKKVSFNEDCDRSNRGSYREDFCKVNMPPITEEPSEVNSTVDADEGLDDSKGKDDVEIDFKLTQKPTIPSKIAKHTKKRLASKSPPSQRNTHENIKIPRLMPEEPTSRNVSQDQKRKTQKKKHYRYDQDPEESISASIDQDPLVLQESSLKNLTFENLKEQKVKIY